MPAPLNLTGRRFGKLLVLSQGSTLVSPSGKSRTTTWHCRCDCGREETIVERRLPHTATNAARSDSVDECQHCRSQRTCLSCKKQFVSVRYVSTCSPDCDAELTRQRDRDFKRGLAAADPNYHKRIHAAKMQRVASDPAAAARHVESESRRVARKAARMSTDLEYAERVREQARRRYAERAEEIQSRRKARLAELSPEQRAELADAARETGRLWREQWRATPEGTLLNRERSSNARRQSSLGALLSLGAALKKRANDDETEP